MGLTISHDAYDGGYTSFNFLRQEVAYAIGGAYPPHYLRMHNGEYAIGDNGIWMRDISIDQELIYTPSTMTPETHPGLWEFFLHSDCDGVIAPDMCAKVADDLEAIMPKMRDATGDGHIAAQGGYKAVLQRFIDGCRLAHQNQEPLRFY